LVPERDGVAAGDEPAAADVVNPKNLSYNYGTEGPTEREAIRKLRERQLDEDARSLAAFIHALIAVRKRYGILSRGRFLTGTYDEHLGVKDVTWPTPEAEEMGLVNWSGPFAKCLGMLLDLVPFKLPAAPEGRYWTRLIDTNTPGVAAARCEFGERYVMTGRSLALLLLA